MAQSAGPSNRQTWMEIFSSLEPEGSHINKYYTITDAAALLGKILKGIRKICSASCTEQLHKAAF